MVDVRNNSALGLIIYAWRQECVASIFLSLLQYIVHNGMCMPQSLFAPRQFLALTSEQERRWNPVPACSLCPHLESKHDCLSRGYEAHNSRVKTACGLSQVLWVLWRRHKKCEKQVDTLAINAMVHLIGRMTCGSHQFWRSKFVTELNGEYLWWVFRSQRGEWFSHMCLTSSGMLYQVLNALTRSHPHWY